MSNALEDAKFRERMRLLEAAQTPAVSPGLNARIDKELDRRARDAAAKLGDDYTFQDQTQISITDSEPPGKEKEPGSSTMAVVERRPAKSPHMDWEAVSVHDSRHVPRIANSRNYEYRIREL